MTRLRCSLGHEWEPGGASAAPLVCPTCGRPPAPLGEDSEKTIDTDSERTMDLPPARGGGNGAEAGKSGSGSGAMPASEMTQTLHFTPTPAPTPASTGSSLGGMGDRTAGGGGGRSMGGAAGRSMGGGGSAGGGGMPGNAAAGGGAMPFTIVRQHARGGLGVVSLARDEQIKREVALKQILPQHVENGVLKRRFLYEAQITGQLEHPSIVPVYCLGSDAAGKPYYVMRFVKGRTLDEIIREHHTASNPIVFRELLRRFIAVCQAVAYAHLRGVIHRDLKPANVMLGDYGETLVLDWGLAKDIKQGGAGDPALWTEAGSGKNVASGSGGGSSGMSQAGRAASMGGGNSTGGGGADSAELTMAGQIIGTPAYMAPEQAEGKTELHGPVTDIYALGGILYKILTGSSPTAPTASGTGATGQRTFTFVPSAAPSKVAKEPVDATLERICVRAMATEAGSRYPRALELSQDIQRWLDEHPLVVKPYTALGKVKAGLAAYAMPVVLGLVGIILVLAMVMALRK